jgi:hypothetical protein
MSFCGYFVVPRRVRGARRRTKSQQSFIYAGLLAGMISLYFKFGKESEIKGFLISGL